MSDDFVSWQSWRSARLAELGGPDSWLGLIGLFWLEHGTNRVGSAPDNAVVLPGGPPLLGVLDWRGDALNWLPVGGEAQPIETDRAGRPTIVSHADYSFFVVERDGRLAVRLRDRAWAGKRAFPGLACFDFDPVWRIEADWLPIVPPLRMEVPNVSGDLKQVEVGWRAAFMRDGQCVELLPMSVAADEVFFVFRDRTSGRESYGAGRFLKASAPLAGRIVLDFNRAYNPPCAFTSFATCPLPPAENWLPFAVPAGEMKPLAGVH